MPVSVVRLMKNDVTEISWNTCRNERKKRIKITNSMETKVFLIIKSNELKNIRRKKRSRKKNKNANEFPEAK